MSDAVHPHIRGAYFQALLEQFVHKRFIPTYVGHTSARRERVSVGPVHPHIRGAYTSIERKISSCCGSSPHTWGILLGGGLKAKNSRFIPTYVGHTAHSRQQHGESPVHPHIRGAYITWKKKGLQVCGSSPHTWGIHVTVTAEAVSEIGSSPHTWGIRPRKCCGPCTRTVHPHIRGAYTSLPFRFSTISGSSPHTWGILIAKPSPKASIAVHPHIRGAYSLTTGFAGSRGGSSPHTWGILHELKHSTFFFAVHPHIRGAYPTGTLQKTGGGGSSPHTWGIRAAGTDVFFVVRFIPTYVGHTWITAASTFSSRVHPHIRGAYALSGITQVTDARFIPTYVGHTAKSEMPTGMFRVHPHIRGAYTGSP